MTREYESMGTRVEDTTVSASAPVRTVLPRSRWLERIVSRSAFDYW